MASTDVSPRRTPSDGRTRVVVTGIGLVTGLNRVGLARGFREESWLAIRSGRSAVRMLEETERNSDYPYPLGCPAPTSVEAGGDPVYDLLAKTADEAWDDAALSNSPFNFDPERAATLIGLSKGGIRSLSLAHRHLLAEGADGPTLGHCWQ
ncbi:hypothetical protein ACYOEI_29755, partial [Singulisphaera rosea]